ncbi:MAG: hypothetical protein ACR2FO_01475 [Actinomycetota bacterium]
MIITTAHRFIGLTLAGIFLVIALFGLVSWISNRDPNKWFWRLLAAGQVGLVVQILAGLLLLVTKGNQPPLHYVYGAFPVLVLLFAHRISKRLQGLEWAAFAVASFFIFGLQLRGMMTGSGAG